MDYCSSCRRHLNGALVCPGCGAYAPDIVPPLSGAPRVSPRPAAPAPTGYLSGTAAAAAELAEATAPTVTAALGTSHDDPSGVLTGVPTAPQGRAARRRQMARWKKNQRRAVVATAVALVGGGLTMASMDRQSAGKTQAAAAPDDRSMGMAGDSTAQVPQVEPAGLQPATPTADPSSHPAHPSSHAGSPAQASAADVPHQQVFAAAPQTAAQAVRTAVHMTTDAVAPQTVTPSSSAAPSSAATASGGTATAAQQPSAPVPATTTAGTGPGKTQAAPAQASTSPTDVCVLGLICLR